MNKTLTINIAGLSFHIDEDAYNKLDAYINAVRNSIQQEENRDEIIADIEGRIAELFAERVDPQTGVIRMTNVDEIINIMGKPEDYIIEDDSSSSHSTYHRTKQTKKIYRDGEKRVLGGVCAGISHYLNVDAVWIRIIFILLFFMYGVSILAYFILWIIIPKATTVADVLEMKGEPVNISNIEKQFREGLSSSYKALKTNGKTAGDIVRKIVGITLILLGSIGAFCSFFVPIIFSSKQLYLFGMDVNQVAVSSTLSIPFWVLNLCLFLITFLPFVLVILLGVKALNPKTKHIGITSLILGVLCLIALFVFSFSMVKSNKFSPFSYNYDTNKSMVKKEDNYTMNFTKKDLKLGKNDTLNMIFNRDERIFSINDTIVDGNNFVENNDIELYIIESNTGQSYIEIEENKFKNNKEVYEKDYKVGKAKVKIETFPSSKTLPYHYAISQDTLVLSNAILATKNKYTRDNNVKVKVFITPDQTIKINSRDDDYIEDVDLAPGTHYYKFQNGRLSLSATNDTIANNL